MPNIVHRIGIEGATAERVCQAVATREGVASWWTENVNGESTVGSVLQFIFGKGGPAFQVLELTPPVAGTPGNPMLGFNPIIMKRLPFPSVVLASHNDERVAFERAEAFALAWGSHLVDVGALGHIGSATKLGLWPKGLVCLGQFIASIGQENDERGRR